MAQSQDVVAECPTCKAVVALDAPECPQCGELFDQGVSTDSPLGADARGVDPSASEDSAEEPKTGSREKFIFSTGIFLISPVAPATVLWSCVHDPLQSSVPCF